MNRKLVFFIKRQTYMCLWLYFLLLLTFTINPMHIRSVALMSNVNTNLENLDLSKPININCLLTIFKVNYCISNHYASETFKIWSLGLTLLKFVNFTDTQILREIKFWRIEMLKKCLFCKFRRFWILILVNLAIFQVPNLPNFKVQNILNCKKGNFWYTKFANIDFT